jgi:pimeloyl-ACP methyl ester carboxylesterase
MMHSGIARVARTMAMAIGLLAACSGTAWSADGAYADLPGVKLWFTDSGGNGAPIILLHANTGTSAGWTRQVQAFSEAGYRIVAFDRRGWGKSQADAATGAQPGSVAGDLDALVNYLKLNKFYLVGVAGGGFAGIDYAAWHPERVLGLVVAASSARLDGEKEMKDITARIDMPGRRKLPVVYMEVSPAYRSADPEGTAQWMENEKQAQQPGAPDQPLRTPNTYAKLETLSVPTLVIAGGADLIAPPGLMRVWAAHVKGAEFSVISDAGHSVAWEQPDAFNSAVLGFIKRH